MAIHLDKSSNKYDALRDFRLETASERDPEPIEPGEKIGVAVRGFYTTDGDGQTLEINGHDTAVAIANMVNHAWDLWIESHVNELDKNDEPLPDKVKSIRIYLTEDEHSVVINPAGTKAMMVPYPESDIKKGDPISIDDLLDLESINPPTLDGQPCSYVELLFKGEQVSVCFDFRPSHEENEIDEWGQEDKNYYSWVVALNWVSRFYGHPPLVIPKLREFDIPLPVKCEQNIMAELIDTVEQDPNREEVDEKIAESFSDDDWEELLEYFDYSDSWRKRLRIFEDALACYRAGAYGGTVTQLMPQVEGVIMDSLIQRDLGLKSNGESKSWSTVVKLLSEIFEDKDFGPFRSLAAEASQVFLKESDLYSGFSWKSGSEELDRHASLHGHNLEYNTKANADRLWMLHDALFWLLGYEPPS